MLATLLQAQKAVPAASQNPGASTDRPLRTAVHVLGYVPHDPQAFTEGFAFWKGRLYESTGEYGQSVLREIDPTSGKTQRQIKLADGYFGEGLTIFKDRLFQLTWREHVCFIYDIANFHKVAEIKYTGEGWGLTNDGVSLIMSDGSDMLRFRDATTLDVKRQIHVSYEGKPVTNLNELEYIDHKIWANVWGTDFILGISPTDGRVTDVIDATDLLPVSFRSGDRNDVLNGIAYDDKTHAVFITGKRWPMMYKIQLPQ